MAMILAKVWPLEPGVKGNAPHDNSVVTLKGGTPGFMELEAAKQAEKDGLVQLMAGIGWGDLKTPRTEAKPKAAPKPTPKVEQEKKEPKNEYRTADMKPSLPKADETEDAPNEYKVTQLQPKRRPGRPPKDAA